ncbi:MAG: carboxypeptidase regulatory-like domain-containing protein [Bacteroidia bacterium]|nr:carboxypeptidase regulatory-like domain-containing protein [Bacteroidia bacterium]
MKNLVILILIAAMVTGIFQGCKKKKDEEQAPSTGTLKGKVTDASTSLGLSDVRIIVYNSSTKMPTGNTLYSASDGSYTVDLSAVSYYLRLEKQGYQCIPPAGFSAITLTVTNGQTSENNYQMTVSTVSNTGMISGKVSNSGNNVGGVLVIAYTSTTSYSTISGNDGQYVIYNVPAGSYTVKGFLVNYNSDEVTASVSSGSETSDKNLSLTQGTSGKATGTVTFLATNNGEVDVTLTFPNSKESIPGLSVRTSGGSYTINNVPNGTFIARASYENDSYVVDPDWILKFGEPTLTINNNTVSLNFSVTGAISLTSPTNDASSTQPVQITTTSPVFTWNSYPSTDDYIIEVSDVNGVVIWGGFTKNGNVITKNISIPKTQTSITFNSDDLATQALQTNRIYRWKIYASKDDNSSLGWKLISSSEDQRGLFIIK